MIDANTQYIIYKERENELMAQIERKQAALERGASGSTGHSWTTAIEQWLKAKVFSSEKAAQRPVHHHAA